MSKYQVTIHFPDEDLELEDLRNRIGYVPQKSVLFSGTIASNLRFGDSQADETQIRKALDIAQASEFVYTDEKGIDAPVAQGGSNVSGGQKQRLQIARAIVKKPECTPTRSWCCMKAM